VKGVRQ